LFVSAQIGHTETVTFGNWLVQLCQNLVGLVRQIAEHLTTVRSTTLPVDQALVFEPVEETCHTGGLLYHPLSNFESWQALGAGAA
jgi:hypothetical protein